MYKYIPALKNNLEANSNQCPKYLSIDTEEKNIDNTGKRGDLDFITNKRKLIEEQSDFEFKKPYNPFQEKIDQSSNSIISDVQSNVTNKVFLNFISKIV